MHDISHGLKANQQITIDGLRRRGTLIGLEKEIPAPLAKRDQQRKQALPFLRQHIFLIGAAVGGRHGIHDAVRDEIAQPGREDVLGRAEAFLKFAESAQPVEGIADDQQRPPVADLCRTRLAANAGLVTKRIAMKATGSLMALLDGMPSHKRQDLYPALYHYHYPCARSETYF